MNLPNLSTEQTKEKHIEYINKAIDAIINLEDYYPQLPNDLSKSLDKLNSLRNLAEEEIEEGDTVYNTVDNTVNKVERVLTKNLFLENRTMAIGKKFCFKTHY